MPAIISQTMVPTAFSAAFLLPEGQELVVTGPSYRIRSKYVAGKKGATRSHTTTYGDCRGLPTRVLQNPAVFLALRY